MGCMGEYRRVSGQASVNSKVETVEELLARRKNLHMGMLKLAREDLALILQTELDAMKVPPPHGTTARHDAQCNN